MFIIYIKGAEDEVLKIVQNIRKPLKLGQHIHHSITSIITVIIIIIIITIYPFCITLS